jgi:hypothetical protein
MMLHNHNVVNRYMIFIKNLAVNHEVIKLIVVKLKKCMKVSIEYSFGNLN